MNAPLMSQLKDLQDENRRLKKLYVEAWLNADPLKGAMAKIVSHLRAGRWSDGW